MAKVLSFKDFVNVDYTNSESSEEDGYLAYRAQKRRRGVIGESLGKLKPPCPDRKKGDRCPKGLEPPFHPKGKSAKHYRSFGKSDKRQEEVEQVDENYSKKSTASLQKTHDKWKDRPMTPAMGNEVRKIRRELQKRGAMRREEVEQVDEARVQQKFVVVNKRKIKIKRLPDEISGDGRMKYISFEVGPVDYLARDTRDSQANQALKGLLKGNRKLKTELDNAIMSWSWSRTPDAKNPTGIMSFTTRIMKEEVEQVDELNKSTLQSYKKKAERSAAARDTNASHYPEPQHAWIKKTFEKGAEKRRKGIELANKKLAREDVEQVDETLDVSQRRKIAIRMKRLAPRLKIAREKALRKTPTMDKIKKRAKKQARNQMFKTLTKGKTRGEVSLARRKEIEKKLDKLNPRIERIARKMIPNVRKLDRERKQSKSKGNK